MDDLGGDVSSCLIEPELPSDLTGSNFSKIFGTQTSSMELFLCKRRIMGPCWLTVRNFRPTDTQISWCQVEVSVDDMKSVR